MDLIKSKDRVVDHGEVFTPAWMVEAMLDLVKDETERIDSRFLEPACGSGNFLVRILPRVLATTLVPGAPLATRTHHGQPITFAEWGYVGKGKFQRRDFRLATLTQSSA